RLCLVLQLGQLTQPIQNLLLRLLISQVVRELQLHVGKAEQRDRAHCREVGSGSHVHLDRNGNVTLDLFRRLAGVLRDDIDERRDRSGIGFDVQGGKGTASGGHHQNKKRQHECAHAQRKGDDSVQGSSAPHARLQWTQLRAYGSSSLNRRKKNL